MKACKGLKNVLEGPIEARRILSETYGDLEY